MLKISYKIFTLVPSLYKEYFNSCAPIKRGIDNNIIKVDIINIRDYALDKHKKVDDLLYGGGPGLLLKPDILVNAVESHIDKEKKVPIIMLDPKGEPYNQGIAQQLSQEKEIVLIAGRYEGFDARIEKILNARLISIGDYILTNGDLGVLTLLDSITRLIEGTCDSLESTVDESFSLGLLEADQYTRPNSFRGFDVPKVLQNGNHQQIDQYKKRASIKNTLQKRPDLFKNLDLNELNLLDATQVLKEMYHVNEHRSDS